MQTQLDSAVLSLGELAIGGKELIDAGIPKGRQLGLLLDELLQEVLEDPKKNEANVLIELAKRRMSSLSDA